MKSTILRHPGKPGAGHAATPPIRFLASGDTALVIELGDRIDRADSERVVALGAAVREAAIEGVVETLPTYRSLMVQYDPLRIASAELIARIEALAQQERAVERAGRSWRLPACFEGGHAPDLAEVAERTGLSPQQAIERHCAVSYHVYMIGFLPGFPYMGDLPEALVLPRRTNPRTKVPPGSVAIAMTMTGIYPVESPGGWHLIGATPIRLFDAAWPDPTLLRAGDRVRFEPIGLAEFDRLRAAQMAGERWAPA